MEAQPNIIGPDGPYVDPYAPKEVLPPSREERLAELEAEMQRLLAEGNPGQEQV